MSDDLDWTKWRIESKEPDAFQEIKGALLAMNLEVLQLLTQIARSPPELSGCTFLTAIGPDLLKMSPRALSCLARAPISLLDISRLPEGSAQTTSTPGHPGVEIASSLQRLDRRVATRLAHSALPMLSSLMHSSREVARVVFGLDARTVAVFAQLGIHGIPHLAEDAGRLRLRWEDRAPVWHELLQLAHQESHGRSRVMELRILQHHLANMLGEGPREVATGAKSKNGTEQT